MLALIIVFISFMAFVNFLKYIDKWNNELNIKSPDVIKTLSGFLYGESIILKIKSEPCSFECNFIIKQGDNVIVHILGCEQCIKIADIDYVYYKPKYIINK